MGVQLVQDDARLGPHPTLLGVHLDDVSHVLGEVDDYGAADGLPGQAGASAPRQHREPVAARLLHDGDDVVGRPRYHDADGLHLVYAGVGAVQHARHLVEAHLARHASLQVFDQGPYVRVCQLGRHGPPSGVRGISGRRTSISRGPPLWEAAAVTVTHPTAPERRQPPQALRVREPIFGWLRLYIWRHYTSHTWGYIISPSPGKLDDRS